MRKENPGSYGDADENIALFHSAEEAWFWYVRCQKLRWEGANIERASGGMQRPCEPDDMFRWLCDCYNARRVGARHLEVLGTYGIYERPPNPHHRSEILDDLFWRVGMAEFEDYLKTRGVVGS